MTTKATKEVLGELTPEIPSNDTLKGGAEQHGKSRSGLALSRLRGGDGGGEVVTKTPSQNKTGNSSLGMVCQGYGRYWRAIREAENLGARRAQSGLGAH